MSAPSRQEFPAAPRSDESGERLVEGVPWHLHVATFRTRDGGRHRLEVWSPGFPWVREEVARQIADERPLSDVVPGSVSIQAIRRGSR